MQGRGMQGVAFRHPPITEAMAALIARLHVSACGERARWLLSTND